MVTSMSETTIRAAARADLPRLTEIYNHYVVNTPITFDIEPYSVERCVAWSSNLARTGDIGMWLGWTGRHVSIVKNLARKEAAA